MKSYIYKGTKYTPSIIKKLGIAFIGTDDECMKKAEELENQGYEPTVESFGCVELNVKKVCLVGKGWLGEYDKNACFVRYY